MRKLVAVIIVFLYCEGFAGSVQIGEYTWSYSITDGQAVILGVSPATGDIIIPDKISSNGIDCPVTRIAYEAFSRCSGLTSLTIPDSVTQIGKDAFEHCSGLSSVTIGNGVTNIGSYAFWGCNCLTNVYISDLSAWCRIAFYDHAANPLSGYSSSRMINLYVDGEQVSNLVVPNGVTSISDYAFYDCKGLTSVTIPNSVTSIGRSSFACGSDSEITSRMTSVEIPNSVTNIGNNAFSYCSGLTDVTIPNSVASIGNSAFSGCRGLTSVTIPDSVVSIGNSAFSGCSGLTSVTIPNGVTSIEAYAFCTAYYILQIKVLHLDFAVV